ncbi:kinase-like protein [Marasmius fiardii PR-910]|nr:kinase-like protein [Marasmius fiardii PR-910]
MIEDFCQEALIWTQFDHPNVLKLLGVNTSLFKADFCLVSPWMENGDIVTFLGKRTNHDRLRSIREIAAGLEYLHSHSPIIVHGDVKGANILVDDNYSYRLADFGLSREGHSSTTLLEHQLGWKVQRDGWRQRCLKGPVTIQARIGPLEMFTLMRAQSSRS